MCSKHSASHPRVFQIFRDYVWPDGAVHGAPFAQQPRRVAGQPPQAPGSAQVDASRFIRTTRRPVDRRRRVAVYAVDAHAVNAHAADATPSPRLVRKPAT